MPFRPTSLVLLAFLLALFPAAGGCETAQSERSAEIEPELDSLIAAPRSADQPTTFVLDGPPTTNTLILPNYPFLRDSKHEWERLPSGVWIRDIHVGSGKYPSPGVAVYLNFKGYLEDGTLFTNTLTKDGSWLAFTYGRGEVIPGLEEGIATMRERGKRILVIPSEMAYGSRGYQHPDESFVPVPPDATLIFDATFLWIREPEWEKLGKFK